MFVSDVKLSRRERIQLTEAEWVSGRREVADLDEYRRLAIFVPRSRVA